MSAIDLYLLPLLSGALVSDYLIIDGGVIGKMKGLQLADASQSAILVERSERGRGASWARWVPSSRRHID